ncbi:MAG: MFS transporter [Caulobacteraceae bacterium]
MTSPQAATPGEFTTDVPARLDRLPWSRFHWLVVTALGVTWILDGLEVTLVGSLSGAIADPRSLGFSASQIGLAASAYLGGAVIGALVFGRLTDSLGRKRLFTATVGLYLVATVLTGFSWNFASFLAFRVLTGAGIGGEYSAVNSAVQELIPARRRGYTDLVINGSYWIGAAVGAMGSLVVLDERLLPIAYGWRFAFAIGGVLGLAVIFIRRYLPESPRWLMTHGQPQEAERVVAGIEAQIEQETGRPLAREGLDVITLVPRHRTTFAHVARTMLSQYPKRTITAFTLMATQAFCYNAIFFTYALILTRFYRIPPSHVGWFMLPFALGNFMGPLLLGHFFDTVGRKPMIAGTYGLAGVLMALTGWLFAHGVLGAAAQTAAWTVIFFFASAGASAAYLTAGESFPLETRAMSIALFYCVGTGIGGVAAPAIFGALIDTGSQTQIFKGYLLGGGLMVVAAIVEMLFGIKAERMPLESVARPLSSVAADAA